MEKPLVFTKIITLLAAGLLALLMTDPCHAGDGRWDFSPYRAQISDADFTPEQAPADETEAAAVPSGKKNIGRGVMFSLVIPGAGQLYAGSWLRAIPWFAVEVAGWMLFSGYQSDGNGKTSEFEEFAGTKDNPNHFRFDAYMLREYQVASNPILSEGTTAYPDVYSDWVREPWSTRNGYLPPPYGHDITTNDIQQYFEMIGKYYSQFGYGWDDTYDSQGQYGSNYEFTGDEGHIWAWSGDDSDGTTLGYDGHSPNFFLYRDMRGDANNFYDKGNLMMELVMVNHVLSALDAAFAIRGFNRKLEESPLGDLNLRYEHKNFDGNLARMMTLSFPLDR